jgi:hypothetical protein
MRILLLAFLFCLHSVANAQQFQVKKVMICDKSEIVFKVLHNDFEETPQWYGKDVKNGTTYVLTANLKDGTWTLIQMDKDIACVMGIGTDPKSLTGKPV